MGLRLVLNPTSSNLRPFGDDKTKRYDITKTYWDSKEITEIYDIYFMYCHFDYTYLVRFVSFSLGASVALHGAHTLLGYQKQLIRVPYERSLSKLQQE